MRRSIALFILLFPALASAQKEPKKSGGGGDDDQDPDQKKPVQRAEPSVLTPNDPLAMSPETKERIGSDVTEMPAPATGEVKRKFLPLYDEQRGDYRFRTVPPFWFEHTRGIGTTEGEDRQSLYGLLYYQRRSKRFDADFLFPLVYRNRDGDDSMLAVGPLVHREAAFSHDNWFTPLVFEGKRKDGGYLHMPFFLMTSRWKTESALTVFGLYFRNRTGTEVDAGVIPGYFHGESGDPGGRKNYTLIPPFAFYHKENELEQSHFTVAGPFIWDSDPKRLAIDFAPLFFHIRGRPDSGGVSESHTTFFPLFHWGHTPDRSLLWLPGYLRRTTLTSDTMITPLYSHALTRNADEGLRMAGPVLPLFFDYRDKRLQSHAWAIAPLYYQSSSKRGFDVLTPLFGRFENYGISRSWWIFPTIAYSTDAYGYEADVYPLAFFGRSGLSSHSVLAPLYWDFKSQGGRSTVAFPLFWRFASKDRSVTEVAGNVVYLQRPVEGGLDVQTHIAPFFSWGSSPTGHFWNVLFGLAGYTRDGERTTVRALWIPIQTGGPKQQVSTNY